MLKQPPLLRDEVAFSELLYVLWRKKYIVFISIIISMLIGGVSYLYTPKIYKSTTTFFLNKQEKSLSGLSQFGAIFGGSTPSNMDSLIKSVLHSDVMKQHIVNDVHTQFFKLTDRSPETMLSVQKKINLNENLEITTSRYGLFQVSYFTQDPELSKFILETFLNILNKLNGELELTPEKEIIKVLDPPKLPIVPIGPNLGFNLGYGFFMGFLLSCLSIQWYYFSYSKQSLEMGKNDQHFNKELDR